MKNISMENNKLIENLKKSVLHKMDSEKEAIDVSSMYGVFLETNKFIICKEEKIDNANELYLTEFFLDEIVAFGHDTYRGSINPWKKGGRMYLDGYNFLNMGFCVPLLHLLENFSIEGETNKKYIVYLYDIVNEYLKENPNFVAQLFDNENKKVR